MAVVHHGARLVFIAEAHTAGRATAAALEQAGGVTSAGHHDYLSDVMQQGLLDRSQLRDYMVVSTVRNHFDALVTWWIHRGRDRSFSLFLKLLVTLPGPVRDDRLYWRYFDDSDLVLRYEALEEQLGAFFRDRTGRSLALPHIGDNHKGDYRKYYTPEDRRLVEQVFRTELRQMGYGYEASSPSKAVTTREPSWRRDPLPRTPPPPPAPEDVRGMSAPARKSEP